MAEAVQKLAMRGETVVAQPGFLNDLLAALWPNINTAGCKMIKEMVEPMFKSMLPGPLKSLHFTKLDLGTVPIHLNDVKVTRTETQGVKLDMTVDWDARCNITLDGDLIPSLGIDKVKMNGLLSILLCPLIDSIPVIGATQIAFVNTPTLNLNFSGAAKFADIGVIDRAISKVILDLIASMAVLPNRYLVKLDASNDYFKTYQHHVGVLRLTMESLTGIEQRKKGGVKGLLSKIKKDVPDCYCKVSVGAEKDVWKTSTKENEENPVWGETHDFLVMDQDQFLAVDVLDADIGSDDDMGLAITSIAQLLSSGGTQELSLVKDGKPALGKMTVKAQYMHFVPNPQSLQQPAAAVPGEDKVQGRIVGLVTVLIDSLHGLKGQKEELHPSVKITWGQSTQRTSITSYSPGVDIFNPSFDAPFRFPITPELLANPASFKLSLMNKEVETGSIEMAFADVLKAQGMQVQDNYKIGPDGSTVRACVMISGTEVVKSQ